MIQMIRRSGFVLALVAMAMLLIGVASATEGSAAYVQATQLQFNIDKALDVGASVIADMNASGKDTNALSAKLDALTSLRAQIDANTSTLDSVKQQRDAAAAIVKDFRESAHATLSADEQARIKAAAEAKANMKLQMRQMMVKNLRSEFNARALEAYVEHQQKLALGLNASENLSIIPQLNGKIAGLLMMAREDKINKSEIAHMRTEVKADIEAIKANRTSVLADVRTLQLQRDEQILSYAINSSTDANLTAQLTPLHASVVALLDAHASGSVTADEFNAKAQALIEQSREVMQGPAFAHVRGDVMAGIRNNRIDAGMGMGMRVRDENSSEPREGPRPEGRPDGRGSIRADSRQGVSTNGADVDVTADISTEVSG